MKPVFKIALLLSLLLVVCFPSLGQKAIDETKKPVLDSLRVILKTPGVVKFLGSRPGPPDPVPESQIASLRKRLEGAKP